MNNYEFTENYGIGYTYNNIPFYFDIEDFDKIKQYQWYIKKSGYVCSSKTKTHDAVYLHRLILNYPKEQIDHKNRNKADLQDAIVARLKAEQELYSDFAPQKELFEKYKICVDK